MWDDNDYCYECTGYGDDWYEDENGELQSRCGDCPFNRHTIQRRNGNEHIESSRYRVD